MPGMAFRAGRLLLAAISVRVVVRNKLGIAADQAADFTQFFRLFDPKDMGNLVIAIELCVRAAKTVIR